MIIKKQHLFIILLLIGIPILCQFSGVTELRNVVSVMGKRPGPNLYLERNDVLKPIPKYSLVKLRDGGEGLYLWVYDGEVHLELDEGGGRTIVPPDQISQVVLHDFNVPVAAIGLGLLTGTVVFGATRTSETIRKESITVTYYDEETEANRTHVIPGGFYESITYYPGNALACGAIGAIAGGYLARTIKKRSTFTIGDNGWQLSIADSYQR